MKNACASALVRFWLLPSLLLASASAATLYWDGSATTVNSQSDNATTTTQSWLNGGRWDNGSTSAPVAAWTAGDAAVFGGTATSQTITAGAIIVGNLTFGQGPLGTGTAGTAYTITGGTLTLSNSTITANTNTTISSVVAGNTGLVKSGPGTLTLTANNPFTGNTTVADGVLVLENPTGSVYTYNGGTISINGPATVRVTGTGSNKRYDFLGKTFSFDGIGGGRIDLPSAGMNIVFALTSNVTNTIITNGGARNNISGGSGFNLGGSSTGRTVFNVARGTNPTIDLDVGVELWNGGGVVKNGSGTLSLSVSNSYAGTTAVNGGRLWVNGSLGSASAVTVNATGTLGGTGTINGPVTIGAAGTLAPGATNPGVLAINNALTLNATGNVAMRIHKSGTSLISDRIGMTGTTGIAYTGALTVTATGDPLAAGDRFTLFSKAAGTFSGSFLTTNLPALGAGLVWDTTALTIDGSIQVLAVGAVAAPSFSLAAGGYLGERTVTLSCATAGATIYYTTDGGTPTHASAIYSSAITIPVDTTLTIKALAAKAGLSDSGIASATYVTQSSATWSNPEGGSWQNEGNWMNGVVGQGTGVNACFNTLTLSDHVIVGIGSPVTIGGLTFGDAGSQYSWTLTQGGGSLILAATSPSVIQVDNQTATLAVVLAGTNGLIKTGAGTLVLKGDNTYTGTTTVDGGTLELNSPNFNTYRGGGIFINNGTKLRITQSGGAFRNDFTNKTFTFGATGGGTIETGPGTNTPLWNNNTFITTGGSQNAIIGHTLNLATTGGITTFSVADGPDSIDLVISLIMDNTGSVLKSGIGTLALTGANAYSGNTTISAGTLQLGNGGTTGSLSTSGTITNNSTLAFNRVDAISQGVHFSGSAISGTGGLVQMGPGSLALTSANIYTGATTVAAGTLLINGSVASSPVTVAVGATLGGVGTLGRTTTVNGTLSPGNSGVGALTINNTLALAATSTTRLEISKTGGLATFDRVLGVTSLTMGGTLTVTASGESLQVGDSFRLFTAATYNGAFTTMNLPAGYVWNTSQLATNGTLTVTAINHPPVFSGYVAATAYQRAAGLAVRKLLAAATDPDGDTLAVTSAGPSSNAGTTVLQAGQILYTPPNNFSGADTFPVTITDALGASVTGTVTISVGPAPTAGGAGNNPPVLTTLPDGRMNIAFQGIPGRSYLVQRSVGGLDNWVTLATVAADASGRVSHTDESPPPGSAFYRLGPL